MAHGDLARIKPGLNIGRQLEETEIVGDGRAFFANTFTEILLIEPAL